MTREEAITILNMVEAHGSLVVQAKDMAIKALEQDPCEDAISRQAVLDKKELVELEDGQSFYSISPEDVEILPSVTPQPKTGRWIEKDGYGGDTYYDCSECGESWTTIDGTPWANGMKYCPNCGARMVEQQESKGCRFYLQGRCTALTEMICKHSKCSFYKPKETMEKV